MVFFLQKYSDFKKELQGRLPRLPLKSTFMTVPTKKGITWTRR
jgi:hypothetical protein